MILGLTGLRPEFRGPYFGTLDRSLLVPMATEDWRPLHHPLIVLPETVLADNPLLGAIAF